MMLWLLIVLFISSQSTNSLSVYENAQFKPIDFHFGFSNLTGITSRKICACHCFENPMCLTAVYIGINQRCSLISSHIQQGSLKVVANSDNTSVLHFVNKTLPEPTILTTTNETVFGIWKTIAGGNGTLATEGNGSIEGQYVLKEIPSNVFDLQNLKYTAYGACKLGPSDPKCGINIGLYLTLKRGASLLVSFRLRTPYTNENRDPMFITMEGTNEISSRLLDGSSWMLIYNGTSGLDPDPGRTEVGNTQNLTNNFIWYSSYRLLFTSKRGNENAGHINEVELLGYQLK